MNRLLQAQEFLTVATYEAITAEEVSIKLAKCFAPERAKKEFIGFVTITPLKLSAIHVSHLTNGRVKTAPETQEELIEIAKMVSVEKAKAFMIWAIKHGLVPKPSPEKLLELSNGRLEVEGVVRPKNNVNDVDMFDGIELAFVA